MNPEKPNPQECYHRGSLTEALKALETASYMPPFRQAAKDWYRNDRGWRPVEGELADYALNVLPPVTMSRGFVVSEPFTHTIIGEPVYDCFRQFGNRWHLMLATLKEYQNGNFPILQD